MTTPEQLEELKAKYPLAFDTIKWPVEYSLIRGKIYDANGSPIELHFTRTTLNDAKDQIGELICELLNQLK